MRIAYLDCFAGISGDMFLGALIDAGVDPQVLHTATAALGLGASLRVETVDRSGISCTKVHVLEGERLAEDAPKVAKAHTHDHDDGHTHQHHPRTQHEHKIGHAHTHDDEHTHQHSHGRSLTVIRGLIQSAALAAPVKSLAIRAFELLGASEAKIHDVPVEQIHFHEVGAVDAIVDIVAASAGIHALGVDRWHCSPLNVGGGMVDCAHGRFPVPAPATADLLKGIPTYSATVQMELVTPTGAALVRALECSFGQQPAMQVEKIGYGAGSRNPAGFPNVLRLSVGEADEKSLQSGASDTVMVLETALDDLSPQILAHVTETALALGALDVMCTAVQMKKGRMGTLLTVLADEMHAPALERLLLRETTTLGIRAHREHRSCLDRSFVSVTTEFGEIRIKVGSLRGEELNAAPEFEDCRSAATAHKVPVKQVIQAATAAYLNGKAR
ncbi:nickel pincer cofactor biosynthesis protein LarC [Granulicella arctica]|uniref:nickel pincer cofactor biosynthesis protein LarC n=1 Tax=Granulicella arctica TaxID=940613 RepID=UPI0021E02E44|nr:nickel pincer cofactor biosynthesis protein LarC [Granulicella arctica]